MNEIALSRDLPSTITVDQGTEFTSNTLDKWCYLCGVKLDFTLPGKPKANAITESFNGRFRDERLNTKEFVALERVREVLTSWQQDYNLHRPPSSLGQLTPSEFAIKGQKTGTTSMTGSF